MRFGMNGIRLHVAVNFDRTLHSDASCAASGMRLQQIRVCQRITKQKTIISYVVNKSLIVAKGNDDELPNV